jgi:hypothetical protein
MASSITRRPDTIGARPAAEDRMTEPTHTTWENYQQTKRSKLALARTATERDKRCQALDRIIRMFVPSEKRPRRVRLQRDTATE